MIYDSHAHYDDEKFDTDRVELLSHLKEHNIGTVVNIGANINSSKRSVELADTFNEVYATVGVHPEDVDELDADGIELLRTLSSHPKVVAIGEIGLDYYWVKDDEGRELQRKWFREQLKLAKEVGLPVNIHSRDAAEDTLSIMRGANSEGIPGIIHCFSYSKEIATEYVKMGYYIGIGGVLTFKNGKKLAEVVDTIPLEKIVLETDCPYMAPEPYRGQRNSSYYLSEVVKKIADIKNVSEEEVERITYENALRIYSKSQRN